MNTRNIKLTPRLAPVTLKKDPPAKWGDLCSLWPLRPIRNEKEYRQAQKIMNTLAILEARTSDQEDYLCVLTMLYASYEDIHHALPHSAMTPLEALRLLVDLHGMNGSDLGRLLGCREMGCMILNGKRSLSKANILKLSTHFKVNPRVFLSAEDAPADKSPIHRAGALRVKDFRSAVRERQTHAMAFGTE